MKFKLNHLFSQNRLTAQNIYTYDIIISDFINVYNFYFKHFQTW
jgi:hypothetical protein